MTTKKNTSVMILVICVTNVMATSQRIGHIVSHATAILRIKLASNSIPKLTVMEILRVTPITGVKHVLLPSIKRFQMKNMCVEINIVIPARHLNPRIISAT